MNKTYIKISGVLNLITAFIHAIAGQADLVNPLMDSNLDTQNIGEWVGVWHMVTILLFFTSYLLLQTGFNKKYIADIGTLKNVGIYYIIAGIPFIIVSIWMNIFAPQWVLLMPIGILVLLGLKSKK